MSNTPLVGAIAGRFTVAVYDKEEFVGWAASADGEPLQLAQIGRETRIRPFIGDKPSVPLPMIEEGKRKYKTQGGAR